jgi:hypothetical protein
MIDPAVAIALNNLLPFRGWGVEVLQLANTPLFAPHPQPFPLKGEGSKKYFTFFL